MAGINGLRLRERWAGWRNEPFRPDSVTQVAVFEKVPVGLTAGTGGFSVHSVVDPGAPETAIP